jgi:hypothetical protein
MSKDQQEIDRLEAVDNQLGWLMSYLIIKNAAIVIRNNRMKAMAGILAET